MSAVDLLAVQKEGHGLTPADVVEKLPLDRVLVGKVKSSAQLAAGHLPQVGGVVTLGFTLFEQRVLGDQQAEGCVVELSADGPNVAHLLALHKQPLLSVEVRQLLSRHVNLVVVGVALVVLVAVKPKKAYPIRGGAIDRSTICVFLNFSRQTPGAACRRKAKQAAPVGKSAKFRNISCT